MIKEFIGILFLIVCILNANFAQPINSDNEDTYSDIFSSIQDVSYGGTINIFQEPSLHVLIEKSIRINEKNGLAGYRIQIYSGTGITARERASSIKQEFIENFPEVDADVIYMDYLEPYFKVKVGDFRNKNEAFELYHSVKKKFPGSYIVKSKINYPKLELPESK